MFNDARKRHVTPLSLSPPSLPPSLLPSLTLSRRAEEEQILSHERISSARSFSLSLFFSLFFFRPLHSFLYPPPCLPPKTEREIFRFHRKQKPKPNRKLWFDFFWPPRVSVWIGFSMSGFIFGAPYLQRKKKHKWSHMAKISK